MAARIALTRITRAPFPRIYTCLAFIRAKTTVPTYRAIPASRAAITTQRRLLTTPVDQTSVVSGCCSGCGATFQDTDSSAAGYIEKKTARPADISKRQGNAVMSDTDYEQRIDSLDPELKELLGITEEDSKEGDEHNLSPVSRQLCARCHSLTHHKSSTTDISKKFLRSTLQYTSLSFLKTKSNALIVSIFDIGDMPFSIEPLIAHLNSNPTHRVILVANKVDILPKNALNHQQRIKDWIIQQAKKSGLNTSSILDVSLVSAIKGWGVKSLLRSIESYRNSTDDVYILGCTNVGKSALVNAFLKQGVAKKEDVSDYAKQHTARLRREYQVTSSHVPGTTIGSIKLPLRVVGIRVSEQAETNRRFITKERYMVDTPGIINEDQLIHLLPRNQIRKWEASKELKPVTYRLEVGKSLLLKPFVRLDLLQSSKPILITLFTKMVPHIVKTDKLDNGAENDLSLKPLPHTIKLNGSHPSHATADIAISSMGWVSVTGEFDGAELRAWVPAETTERVLDVRTPALLPYEYKGSIRKFYGSGERSRQ